MSILPGIYASQITGHLSTNSYESIATVTVGASGTTSYTFSSIPSTYKHLQLRCLTKSVDTAQGYDAFGIQFNGDTAANYAYHQLYGTGAAAGANNGTSLTSILGGYSASTYGSYANMFSVTIVDILDYQNTNKYKTTRLLTGNELNSGDTNSRLRLASGLWQSTSAINSITILESTSYNFAQYSTFALYGIKG